MKKSYLFVLAMLFCFIGLNAQRNNLRVKNLDNSLWQCSWVDDIDQTVLFQKNGELLWSFIISDLIKDVCTYTITYSFKGNYNRQGDNLKINLDSIGEITDYKVLFTAEVQKEIDNKTESLEEIDKAIIDCFDEIKEEMFKDFVFSYNLKIKELTEKKLVLEEDGNSFVFERKIYKEVKYSDVATFGLKGKVKEFWGKQGDVMEERIKFKNNGEIDSVGDYKVIRIKRIPRTKQLKKIMLDNKFHFIYSFDYNASGQLSEMTHHDVGIIFLEDLTSIFTYQYGFPVKKLYDDRKYFNIRYDRNGNWIHREYKKNDIISKKEIIKTEDRKIKY